MTSFEWYLFCGGTFFFMLALYVVIVRSKMFHALSQSLVYMDSPINRHVVNHCKRLKINYTPTFWAQNGTIQSILHVLLPNRYVSYTREILDLKDGGIIALDWATTGVAKLTESSPVLLLIPGLTGCAVSMSPICIEGIKKGFRCVVFNKRGHGGSKLKTARFQSFGDTSDLREAVQSARRRFPAAKLTMLGSSAGSGLLGCYLGNYGQDPLLAAAVAVSPGYSAKTFLGRQEGLPWIARKALLHGLKTVLRSHAEILKGVIDVDAALNANSLHEFEERVYCKMYGFDDLDEYWMHNDPGDRVALATIPFLCVNSKDDPIFNEGLIEIPYEMFRSNPNAMLVLTERGGHCGFWEGIKPESWIGKLSVDYLYTVLDYTSSNGY